MSFPVEWDDHAKHDVAKMFGWIERRSPAGAANWHRALTDAIERIAADPARFAVSPEGLKHKRDARQALFGTAQGRRYRVVFVLEGPKVKILRVRGPGRRPLRKRDLGA